MIPVALLEALAGEVERDGPAVVRAIVGLFGGNADKVRAILDAEYAAGYAAVDVEMDALEAKKLHDQEVPTEPEIKK